MAGEERQPRIDAVCCEDGSVYCIILDADRVKILHRTNRYRAGGAMIRAMHAAQRWLQAHTPDPERHDAG